MSRSFVVGFLAGMSLFVIANVYSYSQMNDFDIADLVHEFGWPFPLYRSGTILHLDNIIWGGLVTNISTAVLASLIVGQICAVISEHWRVR